MTIKELIEILSNFDEELVIVTTGEEYNEPYPYVERYSFDCSYYSNQYEFITIPKNKEFMIL